MSHSSAFGRPGKSLCNRRQRAHRAQLLVIAATAALGSGSAMSAPDTHWWQSLIMNGSWNTSTNWDPAGPPDAGDTAMLLQADGVNRLARYDGFVPLAAVTIDATGSGRMTMEIALDRTLTVTNEVVGSSGTGNVTQSLGVHAATTLSIGDLAGSAGTYALSGSGSLSASGPEYVGRLGNAWFAQTGGTHSIGSSWGQYYAYGAETTARYDLSGGRMLLPGGAAFLGFGGAATFAHSSGTYSLSNLYMGWDSAASGTYTLSSGGTLTAESAEHIGHNGYGTFEQSGGVNTLSGELQVGYQSTAHGTYTLSGGSLMLIGDMRFHAVGAAGSGYFAQTGGACSITSTESTLYIGNLSTASGTYSLGGTGTLSVAGAEHIGHRGAGRFDQSAGRNAVSGEFAVGYYPTSSGSYTLSGGGVLDVAGSESVGYQGTGAFQQNGGTHTVHAVGTAGLTLGAVAGAVGSYALAGGTLDVQDGTVWVGYNGSGTFAQSGGQATAEWFYVGNQSGGGWATLGPNGTLSVGVRQIVGGKAAGTFVQSGGLNHVAGDGLLIGDERLSPGGFSNSYIISGGTLEVPFGSMDVARANSSSTVSQSGGTVNARVVRIGVAGAVNGLYSLSDSGTLTAVYQLGVGESAPGTVMQSGGICQTPLLKIAEFSLGNGRYDLSGGTLVADTITRGAGTATFKWTGGTLKLGTWDHTLGNLLQSGPSAHLSVVDQSTTIGIGGAGAYFLVDGLATIGPGRTLSANIVTVGNGMLAPTMNVNGTLAITGSLTVKSGTVNLNSSQTVPSPLAVTNGKLVINAPAVTLGITNGGSPIPQATINSIWALVLSGQNGGSWNGNGIIATTIAHPTLNGLGLQLTDSSHTLTVREMILGDVNGDDRVTIGDVMVALNSSNYQQDGTWLNGDVNYDGRVTIGDVMLMLNSDHYQQVYDPANAPAQLAALQAAGLGDMAGAAIPEPATLALAALGATGLLAARQRRRGG